MRNDLPALPERMKKLPLDDRGYPVPWFVHWQDGVPDFRVVGRNKVYDAYTKRLCWVCGETLGRHLWFVIGPMCAVNRITAEPACHKECAEFAAMGCPFLTKPMAKRNTRDEFPAERKPPVGVHLDRNPGATCLWVTGGYYPFRVDGGNLFRLGDPERVHWYANGRLATRDEIETSISGGLVFLVDAATRDGPDALAELQHNLEALKPWLPKA